MIEPDDDDRRTVGALGEGSRGMQAEILAATLLSEAEEVQDSTALDALIRKMYQLFVDHRKKIRDKQRLIHSSDGIAMAICKGLERLIQRSREPDSPLEYKVVVTRILQLIDGLRSKVDPQDAEFLMAALVQNGLEVSSNNQPHLWDQATTDQTNFKVRFQALLYPSSRENLEQSLMIKTKLAIHQMVTHQTQNPSPSKLLGDMPDFIRRCQVILLKNKDPILVQRVKEFIETLRNYPEPRNLQPDDIPGETRKQIAILQDFIALNKDIVRVK